MTTKGVKYTVAYSATPILIFVARYNVGFLVEWTDIMNILTTSSYYQDFTIWLCHTGTWWLQHDVYLEMMYNRNKCKFDYTLANSTIWGATSHQSQCNLYEHCLCDNPHQNNNSDLTLKDEYIFYTWIHWLNKCSFAKECLLVTHCSHTYLTNLKIHRCPSVYGKSINTIS